jgi:hypothetical protein
MAGSWLKRFYKRADFTRTQPTNGAREVIRWWESRRLFFNTVVGCTGLVTCFLLIICAFTADSFVGEPIGMPDGPLLGVFLIVPYALLANLFYTGGWVTELLILAGGKAQSAAAFGVKAFRIGVAAAFGLAMRQLRERDFDVSTFSMQKGPLGRHPFRRERWEGKFVPPELLLNGRKPVHKRRRPIRREQLGCVDGSTPGISQPFVIEPVIDLNHPELLRLLLSD